MNGDRQQPLATGQGYPPPFVIGIDLGTTNSLMAVAGRTNEDRLLPTSDPAGEADSSLRESVPVRLLQLPQTNLDGTTTSNVLFPSVVFQQDASSPMYVGIGARDAKYTERRNQSVFYSVKLDLGTDCEFLYPGAVNPELNNPVKVSAAILRAMKNAAEKALGRSLSGVPTVITIPASFMSPQRRDTLRAAQMAGLELRPDALFDEPVAALLGYINRRRIQQRWNPNETVLVFDFGGGTCDVTIIDVSWTPSNGVVTLKMLAISRFERLGGDDIDRHLVHTRLKEEFYRVSGRREREWGFGERQHRIWSQLAKVSELLKMRYCQELDKVAQTSGWNEMDMQQVAVTLPPQTIQTSQGEIAMPELPLNWNQFTELMAPFLDPKCSLNEDKEYYRLTSIFTPILDALDKADLNPKAVTRILLAGGSSYNPLVEHALQQFFAEATVDRPEYMDQLVAEGAAVHAYMRYVLGHDVLQPIAGDTLGLLTEGGEFVPLIRAGAPIPFPPNGSLANYTQFHVPRESMEYVDLVICAGSAARPVHSVRLQFGRRVRMHTPVHLEVGLNANKIFTLKAFLPEYPDITVQQHIDNPLGLLPMTSMERRRRELEGFLQRAKAMGAMDQHTDEMLQLANVLLNLNRAELALQWIDQAERRGGPDDGTRHARAYAHYLLGETDEAYKIYSELSNKQPGDWVSALMAGRCANSLQTQEMYMRRAVAAAPGRGTVYIDLANVLVAKGDFAGSKDALLRAQSVLEAERAHASNPRRTYIELAHVYDVLGEHARAEHTRQQAANFRTNSTGIDDTTLVGIAQPLAR